MEARLSPGRVPVGVRLGSAPAPPSGLSPWRQTRNRKITTGQVGGGRPGAAAETLRVSRWGGGAGNKRHSPESLNCLGGRIDLLVDF